MRKYTTVTHPPIPRVIEFCDTDVKSNTKSKGSSKNSANEDAWAQQ